MKFIDLASQYKRIKEDVDLRIHDILDSSQFIGGKVIKEMENDLAKFVGRKHCISCGNGTDAIQLSFMALEIGEGDAFFCPNMTFIASVEPGILLGATPVLCEINDTSYNLCPHSLEEQIIRVIKEKKLKPKAVVVVDFLGNPADYDLIIEICDRYDLYLIEDAAQSISSSYKGKKCGSFGIISTTSFFPSKPLGCYGDGGAVFTDDDELASVIESLKVHGKGKNKYDNVRVGVNSRLDAIQAAVILSKLVVIESENENRQVIADRYYRKLNQYIKVPIIDKENISSFAQYVLLANSVEEREIIIEYLDKYEIPSLIYYPSTLANLKATKYLSDYAYPVSDNYAKCNFGLPFSPYLTKEDQYKVIEVLIDAIKFAKDNCN